MLSKYTLLWMLCVFPIVGCQTQPSVTAAAPSQPATLSSEDYAVLDAGVRQVMKDPASVMISGVTAVFNNGHKFACGYVNARNSFGGYVGDTPFIGMFATGSKGRVFAVVGASSSPSGVAATRKHCAMYGMYV